MFCNNLVVIFNNEDFFVYTFRMNGDHNTAVVAAVHREIEGEYSLLVKSKANT